MNRAAVVFVGLFSAARICAAGSGCVVSDDVPGSPADAPVACEVAEMAGLEDVALDGDFAAVLAAFEEVGPRDGVVYVLRRDGRGWVRDAKILQPDPIEAPQNSLYAIALSGDRLAIGADRTGYRTGAVFTFRRSGDTWSEEGIAEPASTPTDRQFSGMEIALDGDLLASCDRVNDLTYVFRWNGSRWRQEAALDPRTDGWQTGRFGRSVAASGDLVAVSDDVYLFWNEATHEYSNGAVFLYRNTNGRWSFEAVARGEYADSGCGGAIALSGDTLVFDRSYNVTEAGEVSYVWRRREGTWAKEAELRPPPGGSGYFGSHFSIHGDTILVSAPGADAGAGAAYLFRRGGSCWTLERKLVPPAGTENMDMAEYRPGSVVADSFADDQIFGWNLSFESAPLPSSRPFQWLIPAVTRAPGAAGERWVSDVVLHNPSATAAEVDLYFLTRAEVPASWPFVLGPGRTERLDDLVSRKFGKEATGALLIASSEQLGIASRTFNDAATGTYGQSVPAVGIEEAMKGGSVRIFPSAEDGPLRRTNFGAANPSAVPVELFLELFDEAGAPVASKPVTVPAWGYQQVNRIVPWLTGRGSGAGWIRVTNRSPGALAVPWVSIVDTGTGDAVLESPVEAATARAVVPAVAHANGLNGSVWSSDLVMVNPGPEGATVSIEPIGIDRAPVTLEIPAGGSRTIGDVLFSLFGASGAAALELVPSGPIAAWSRTVNDAPGGRFGQAIAAAPPSCGSAVRLTGLAFDPSLAAGYRTNLGFVNAGETTARARITFLAGDGAELAVRDVDLWPRSYRAMTNVFDGILAAPSDELTVDVELTVGAEAIAWASIVDNRTGDPIFVAAESCRIAEKPR